MTPGDTAPVTPSLYTRTVPRDNVIVRILLVILAAGNVKMQRPHLVVQRMDVSIGIVKVILSLSFYLERT